MSKLQTIYPNFIIAMDSMKKGTDTRLHSSDISKIKYIMSFIVFNNKLGDISIELNEVIYGHVAVTLTTIKGFIKQAATTSKVVENDLLVEEWMELISETMVKHNSNSDHQKVLLDFTARKLENSGSGKSGCLSVVLSVVFLISLFYLTTIK